MIGEVDFSMGFEELEHPKYLRFPLWLLYFTAPNTKDPGKEFVAKFSRKWTGDRPFFCSQIASHDERGNGRGLRTSCTTSLSEIGEVLNTGKLLNNSKILQDKYHNDPSYFLRNCRFNICLENSSALGYVTEKKNSSTTERCYPDLLGWPKSSAKHYKTQLFSAIRSRQPRNSDRRCKRSWRKWRASIRLHSSKQDTRRGGWLDQWNTPNPCKWITQSSLTPFVTSAWLDANTNSQFKDSTLFSDDHHLNDIGATLNTNWIKSNFILH